VLWAHQQEVRQLRAGAPHPQREVVLQWARLVRHKDRGWASLTGEERELVLALESGGADSPATTPAVERYLRVEAELKAVYYERLRPVELAKIRRALDELRAWLDGR
jgi:hypothetical protein